MKCNLRPSAQIAVESPSMRREWIEIFTEFFPKRRKCLSPSMRREWIEITYEIDNDLKAVVSLHAEGVD